MIDDFKPQINELLMGEELVKALTVLPPYRSNLVQPADRITALLDIYRIYIPSYTTLEIYSTLYLAFLNSIDKKGSLQEVAVQNENFKQIAGLHRYGLSGGMESLKIVGRAGVGKTSTVQRCAEVIGNEVLVSTKHNRQILPFLFVECVADGSFKSLLWSILVGIDKSLGTTYIKANKMNNVTTDALLGAVSIALSNYVAVLIVDEIERVANEGRKGETLINYLTQLVNQSGVSVVFVGNTSSETYFAQKEYLARRMLGITIRELSYEQFCSFTQVLFTYQYTANKIEADAAMTSRLYALTNGLPSLLVSLFAETQRAVIMSGEETLSLSAFEKTFCAGYQTMLPHIDLGKKTFVSKPIEKPKPAATAVVQVDDEHLFATVAKAVDKNIDEAIKLLQNYISVEFVEL